MLSGPLTTQEGMMTRNETATAAAELQGKALPNEGTKAWLELVVDGREAELAAAQDEIATLQAQVAEASDAGAADHPPAAPAAPPGDAYVMFVGVRQVPGAVLGPGLAMKNPSYEVLQQASWVWASAEEYEAAERKLLCLADGTIREAE
jgi:hypothetical protein